jgi:hypothetical protein
MVRPRPDPPPRNLAFVPGGSAPAIHAHAQSDVTGLVTSLAGKADSSHAHAIADITGLQTALDGKDAIGGGAVSGITPTGSPFVWQNTGAADAIVIISGGVVTVIELSRDGAAWYLSGLIVGTFMVPPSDRLRVTYAVAPTMTLFP